jgi:co-chaperonin GroES (HSP10)
MVTSARKLSEIAERIGAGDDPRHTLIAAIGQNNIDNYEPALNLVLVATYVRSEKTKGGIIIGGDKTRAEDRFQGKIGLVLKLGPSVNKSERAKLFDGRPLAAGDWIMYRASDAHEFFFIDANSSLDGCSARLIEDGLIMGRVTEPEAIY